MSNIIEIVNDIDDFDGCILEDNIFHGPTITFLYKNNITVNFYKNNDGFAGNKGGITCSLSEFNPSAREIIYTKVKDSSTLIKLFEEYLDIKK